MSNPERERIQHFRQRWAEENFRSSFESNEAMAREFSRSPELGRDNDLSEIEKPPPISPREHRPSKSRQKSWLDNFRVRSPRLAEVTAPAPADEHYESDQPIPSDEEVTQSSSPPKPPDEKAAPKPPGWLNELYILSWLTLFALFGTLARLGVEAITLYPNAPVTSRVLWANLGGSFFMGFLSQDRRLFAQPDKPKTSTEAEAAAAHLKFKKTIPLYIGLATGFCGSFTSFSSYIRDIFLALSNNLDSPSPTHPYQSSPTAPAHRNGGFSFLALLAILILHPAVSLSALTVGGHFAVFLGPVLRRPIPATFVVRVLDPLALLLGPGCWLVGALFMTIFTPPAPPSATAWRTRALIPLLWAPPGCILRYYLAKYLNRPSTPNFPYGTFVANVLGTLVLGMAWDLQHAASIGGSSGSACAVLYGLQEGFCGCLTTVSTWVVELNGLSRRWGWWYGVCSVGVGLAGLICIMGGMAWTSGFTRPVCG